MLDSKIELAILPAYQENSQQLHLYNQPQMWVPVLDSRDWTMLKKLSLFLCQVNDGNIEAVGNKSWPQLNILHMQKYDNHTPSVGPSGLMKMIDTEFPLLKQLNLSGNFKIGSAGAKILSRMGLLNLQKIFLQNCQIGNEGSRHLMKSKWPKLKYLKICPVEMEAYTYMPLAVNTTEPIRLYNDGASPSVVVWLFLATCRCYFLLSYNIQTNSQFFGSEVYVYFFGQALNEIFYVNKLGDQICHQIFGRQ